MPDELIKTDSSGGILTVTLARSDKKNALIDSMYGAMADALEAAENDPSIRVVLLQSEGDMFTAGNFFGGDYNTSSDRDFVALSVGVNF